jgi:uncharacterized protein with LGFP repeats
MSADQSRASTTSGQPTLPSGPIEEHHHRYGGASGILGTPIGDEDELGDAVGGRRRHYRGELRGTQHSISLDQPDSREEPSCHNPQAGVRRTVESSIYWSLGTGAHVVLGSIRELWLSLGGQESELGYPTSDEMATPDGGGRMNTFEGGEIWWHPGSGAEVRQRGSADR